MQNKIYFPGLNGIRFLAAFSVVIYHIEQFKGFLGLNNSSEDTQFFLSKILLNGRDAVTLFFVLSGFLITYLLLTEHQVTGTIAIKKFYLRRMLRIWPLYYLIVLVGFVFIPAVYHFTNFEGYYISLSQNFWLKLGLLGFFLPNVADLLGIYVLGAMHLWTIGVEEQFYLLWPQLLKRFARWPLLCLLGVIAFKAAVLAISMAYRDDPAPLGIPLLYPVVIFIANFRIESMAIGGIGAYLVFTQRDVILRLIFHPIAQVIILALMIMNSTVMRSTGLISDAGLSVLYTLFILIVAVNPRPLLNLENRYFSALGQFSYGIYMFHPAIIYTVLVIFSKLGFTDPAQPLYNPVLYLVVVTLTLGISALSYRYFEMPFLRLKSRLAVIRSGDTLAASTGWVDRLISRFLPARRAAPVVEQ